METQKTSYIPTVNGVPVKDWDGLVDFISDPIEFPYSIPWSLHVISEDGRYDVYHSNTNNFNDAIIFDSLTDVNISDSLNKIKTGSYFGSRYMFFKWNNGSSPLSVIISK
jgi:hypothetical protein